MCDSLKVHTHTMEEKDRQSHSSSIRSKIQQSVPTNLGQPPYLKANTAQ